MAQYSAVGVHIIVRKEEVPEELTPAGLVVVKADKPEKKHVYLHRGRVLSVGREAGRAIGVVEGQVVLFDKAMAMSWSDANGEIFVTDKDHVMALETTNGT